MVEGDGKDYQNSLKKTQKEIENTVENFRALINRTIEGIFIIKGNKILFSNIEALKMFNINKKYLTICKTFSTSTGSTCVWIVKNKPTSI